MSILVNEQSAVKPKTVRSLLSEILMQGNVPIDEETSRAIWRVVCRTCSWKYELGEGIHLDIGVARARAHSRKTGHTDIRNRFDLFDCDGGPVDVRSREELGR